MLAVPLLVGAGLVAVACSKPASPGSAATTPATPAATGGAPSVPPGQTATPVPIDPAAEQQDLQQAQQDIADLEKALSQADSGLNANPTTEGDVNP